MKTFRKRWEPAHVAYSVCRVGPGEIECDWWGGQQWSGTTPAKAKRARHLAELEAERLNRVYAEQGRPERFEVREHERPAQWVHSMTVRL